MCATWRQQITDTCKVDTNPLTLFSFYKEFLLFMFYKSKGLMIMIFVYFFYSNWSSMPVVRSHTYYVFVASFTTYAPWIIMRNYVLHEQWSLANFRLSEYFISTFRWRIVIDTEIMRRIVAYKWTNLLFLDQPLLWLS